jgi:hypothetical protein
MTDDIIRLAVKKDSFALLYVKFPKKTLEPAL